MTNRAAIYARVSTEDQAERQTITVQVDACRAYCEKQGWAVVEECLDDGVSGATSFEERPGGQRLLTLLEGKQVDHVVIYCVDRLSRDMATGVPAYNRLVRLTNGHVDFVMNSFDDSPEGRFQFTIFMGVATLEREVIKRRTMGGITKKVRAGMYRASVPPYGYRYDPETRQLVVREDTAEVVRRIYELYLTGMGHRAIVTELMKANVPPPAEGTTRKNTKGWHVSRVRHFLLSPVYKGEGVYRAKDPNRLNGGKREEIAMPCPPIIAEATWDLVQRRHEERGVRWEGPRTKHLYLLSKMLHCDDCGGNYSPFRSHDKSYYRCHRRAIYSGNKATVKAHEGKRWNWPAATIDGVVKAFVRRFMSDPEHLAPYVDAAIAEKQAVTEAAHADVAKLERRLAELEAEEASLLRLKDKEQMVRLLDANAEARKRVDKELKVVRQRSLTVEDTRQALINLRAELWELTAQAKAAREKYGDSVEVEWPEPGTEEEWRLYVRHLIDKVWITGSGKKLSVRFEGVLHHELRDASPVVIGDSPPR